MRIVYDAECTSSRCEERAAERSLGVLYRRFLSVNSYRRCRDNTLIRLGGSCKVKHASSIRINEKPFKNLMGEKLPWAKWKWTMRRSYVIIMV